MKKSKTKIAPESWFPSIFLLFLQRPATDDGLFLQQINSAFSSLSSPAYRSCRSWAVAFLPFSTNDNVSDGVSLKTSPQRWRFAGLFFGGSGAFRRQQLRRTNSDSTGSDLCVEPWWAYLSDVYIAPWRFSVNPHSYNLTFVWFFSRSSLILSSWFFTSTKLSNDFCCCLYFLFLSLYVSAKRGSCLW